MSANSNSVTGLRQAANRLGMPENAILLLILTDRQLLEISSVDGIQTSGYPVSTSHKGLGEQINSFKTPRGFHEIVERYGDREPAGMIFDSRVPTGMMLQEDQWRQLDGDKILSRILRLSGREAGFNQGGNVDSYQRMIYLHGTNQEQYVGKSTSSHGCIRMLNHDIIALYNLIQGYPAWCWIGASVRAYPAPLSIE